jgi:uncharacterized protein (DUF488 family)
MTSRVLTLGHGTAAQAKLPQLLDEAGVQLVVDVKG